MFRNLDGSVRQSCSKKPRMQSSKVNKRPNIIETLKKANELLQKSWNNEFAFQIILIKIYFFDRQLSNLLNLSSNIHSLESVT